MMMRTHRQNLKIKEPKQLTSDFYLWYSNYSTQFIMNYKMGVSPVNVQF